MEECPRCGMNTMQDEKVLNAVSRRDNRTLICSECGVDEAMFDFKMARLYKAISDQQNQESAWLHSD